MSHQTFEERLFVYLTINIALYILIRIYMKVTNVHVW